MKKLFSLILFLLATMTISAQNNPNRLFIWDKVYGYRGYLVEHIDSIVFKRIDEDIHVDVKYLGFNNDDPSNPIVMASFKRSPNCFRFSYMVMPKSTADEFTDDAQIADLMQYGDGGEYYEDYDEGAITNFDFEFVPGAAYTIVAMAYDCYGIPCRGTKVDFNAPAAEIVGHPDVRWTVDSKTINSITMTMTPNKDCKLFFYYLFNYGEAEELYDKYACNEGYVCMGDMIKGFCQENIYTGPETRTWDKLKPNKKYQLYIQPVDANINYAPMIIADVATESIGGEGVASVNIDVKEFGNHVNGYYQRIVFTPNDQCAAHRDMIVYKELFDNGTYTHESYVEYMKNNTNPDYPDNVEDPFWDNYGVDDVKFYADPNTTYYAYSIGKNINGEYGEPVRVEFTTPSAEDIKTTPVFHKGVSKRVGATNDLILPGGKVLKKRTMLNHIYK